MMGDNADIMPDLGIHWWWHSLTKAVDKRPHHQVYSPGTVGTGEPVCFTEYQGVRKSGVDLYTLIQTSVWDHAHSSKQP